MARSEGGSAPNGLPSLLQVTPVHQRFELTRLLLAHRKRVNERARKRGVRCETVIVGDDENLATAEELGFPVIEAPNVLSRRFNDGYQYGVDRGFDLIMAAGSDHVFDPRLLVKAAKQRKPETILLSKRYTVVRRDGLAAISYRHPVWVLPIYPAEMVAAADGRPADETLMRGCDTSTYVGVLRAWPLPRQEWLEIGPLDLVQFCSDVQVTAWEFHQRIARRVRSREGSVPWAGIAALHGSDFANDMRRFYGLTGE